MMILKKLFLTESRYLTLSGGTWTPRHPKRTTTGMTIAAALLPAALISIAACFNGSANVAGDTMRGLMGSSMALGMLMGVRRLQYNILDSVSPRSIIDTQPTQGMLNSTSVKKHAEMGALAVTFGGTTLIMAPLSAGMLFYPFIQDVRDARLAAVMGSIGLTTALCQWERRTQLSRIAKNDYVLIPPPSHN